MALQKIKTNYWIVSIVDDHPLIRFRVISKVNKQFVFEARYFRVYIQ